MGYTVPAGSAVNLDLTTGYTVPTGDTVDFALSITAITSVDIAMSATTPLPSAEMVLDYINGRQLHLCGTTALPQVEISADVGIKAIVDIYAPAPSAALIVDFNNDHVIQIGGTTEPPQAVIRASRGTAATIRAITAAPNGQICVDWGDKIPGTRLVGGTNSSGYLWGAASRADGGSRMDFNEAPGKEPTVKEVWSSGVEHDAELTLPYNKLPSFDIARDSPWSRVDHQLSASTQAKTHYPLPADLDKQQPWDRFSSRIDLHKGEPWNYPPPVDVASDYHYQGVEYWEPKPVWDTRDYPLTLQSTINFDMGGDYSPPPGNKVQLHWGLPSPYPNQPIRPTDPGKQIAHNVPPTIDESRQVIWGDGSWSRPVPDYEWAPEWEIEAPEAAPRPAQPQIREVYIFMPVLMLYRIPDGAEINATNVSWATDADSWGWRFNATIKQESDLSLLKPDSNGPREIACEINGHAFKGMVESYSRSRQFGETAITIKGRSLSGWISDPYAPKRSKAIDATYTAQQLAEQELANTGWTLDWQTADWLIPSGAFSYHELDPIAVIKRIAATAGAIVQSHPSNKQLIIKPRYPVSPHKWNDPSTTLDAILPAALIQQAGSEFLKLPTYNRAISAGGATGGVIVTLTRDGTAGDELAPIITDDLITHQEAGYERNRNEIAKGGSWEMMSFTTWLTQQGQSPGLMLPGHLVEIQDTDTTYPVQIASTIINAQSSNDALTVRQQLTAERKINA